MLNYLLLVGSSPEGEQEIFSLQEMIDNFDPTRISKSPAIFDTAKLRSMNGEYIRRMTPEQFMEAARPYIEATVHVPCDTALLAEVLQKRTEVLGEIPEQIDFIDALPEYSNELYTSKKMKTNPENSKVSLEALLPVLEGVSEADWNQEVIHDKLFALIEQMGVKNGLILWPLRVALSGKERTPGGGIELAVILGREESLARIRKGIAQL